MVDHSSVALETPPRPPEAPLPGNPGGNPPPADQRRLRSVAGDPKPGPDPPPDPIILPGDPGGNPPPGRIVQRMLTAGLKTLQSGPRPD